MVEINNMGGKPDYNNYVEYMEGLGWRRSQLTLDENNSRIVSILGGANTVNTSAAVGSTTAIIDVRCPAGQKISIMGTQQVPRGSDARTAHALRLRLAGTSDVEINQLTKIRITKEKTTEDIVQLARIFYNDVSMTKQLGAVTAGLGSTTLYKDDSIWYRFKQGIEMNGEEHLFIYVMADAPTVGTALPDIAINAQHVKFALDVDIWTS